MASPPDRTIVSPVNNSAQGELSRALRGHRLGAITA
jgi:hypothetical protein